MYVLFGVLTSVASSTGIVLLNKLLFAHDDFTFPATLTGWHLLITHGVLSAAIRLNVFQSKRLARKYIVWFCVFDAAAMALQNLSLTYNTINFYQTCKLFTIPVTVIIERFAGQAFPKASKMVSLALITCGVALCTGANFNTNTIGVCVGLGATIGSALVLVSTSWLQKSQGLSSSQLLHNVVGIDGLLLATLGPFLDYHLSHRILYKHYEWSTRSLVLVGSTCALAVIVNYVTFYLLGKISPISYQVLGQTKTMMIYSAGYYIFDRKASAGVSVPGTSLAFAGCIMYAWTSSKSSG